MLREQGLIAANSRMVAKRALSRKAPRSQKSITVSGGKLEVTTADKLEAPCEDCGEQPNGRLHDSTHVYNHRYTPIQGWVAGNTADKLEAEAKRLRELANDVRYDIMPAVRAQLSADARAYEALAAAWRGLIVADEAIGDHAVRLTDGTWVCSICKAINMINALEI